MNITTNFRKILKILFKYDDEARLNLFELFPSLKRFFLNRKNLLYVRSFGDIIFTLLIIFGIFGPQEADKNIVLFISWGVWWTSIVLSWFFAGRLWCGFCPFPGVGRIFQHLGLTLNLDIPPFLRRYCPYISVVLLAIIIYIEAVTDMKNWPAGTGYLLLSILLGATISGILFKGQAWCRHMCPMGKIIGSASTLSISEFRPDRTICKSCKSFSCKKGKDGIPGCPVYLGAYNVRNNLDCLVCGRCIGLCESNSPRINLRNPFVELIINKGRHLTCAYIIPFLMGSQIARFIQHQNYYGLLQTLFYGSNLLTFSVLLASGFFLFILISRVGSKLFGLTEDEVFGRFSPMIPVLVPLAFTGELVYRLEYFLSHLGDFLPTLGRQFGFSFDHLTFLIDENIIHLICIAILCIGGFAGSYVIYLFNKGDFQGIIKKTNYIILHLLIFSILAAYIITFSY
ncbi:MAG: 4Fe-4S binding protein [Thermodesulfovibrionales bacterium]|nr:4Fe-4S binding protein [Thermodesulfovibrionales bacterium]